MAEKPDVSKLDKVLEGYKPIPMKRLFYPRGMKLSEAFVNAFHREYDRLLGEGQNPKTLVERFGKAMKFHKNESRKYHQLDEEKATRELEEKKESKKKYDPRSKQYFTPVDRNRGCKGYNGSEPEKPAKDGKKLKEETHDRHDRRTKQGDHLPGPEGSSPGSYHSRPDGRKVRRKEHPKRAAPVAAAATKNATKWSNASVNEASEWNKKREAKKDELKRQGEKRDAESAEYRQNQKHKKGNKVTINPLTDKTM